MNETKNTRFKLNVTSLIIIAILIVAVMSDTYLPIADWFFAGEISKESDEYELAEYALLAWQTGYYIFVILLVFLFTKLRDWVIKFFNYSSQSGIQWQLIFKVLIVVIILELLTYMLSYLTMKWMGPREAFYFSPNMFYVLMPMMLWMLIVSIKLRIQHQKRDKEK